MTDDIWDEVQSTKCRLAKHRGKKIHMILTSCFPSVADNNEQQYMFSCGAAEVKEQQWILSGARYLAIKKHFMLSAYLVNERASIVCHNKINSLRSNILYAPGRIWFCMSQHIVRSGGERQIPLRPSHYQQPQKVPVWSGDR